MADAADRGRDEGPAPKAAPRMGVDDNGRADSRTGTLLGIIDNPRNGPRLVISLAAIMILGMWLSIGLHVSEQRSAIMAAAEQELRGASFTLSSHARRTIEAVNTTLRAVDSWLSESSKRPVPPPLSDLATLIEQLQQSNEDPVDIRPIDADGYLFRFAGTDSFRAFVGDRPYIRQLAGAALGTLQISEPLVSRDSGRRVLPIAMRASPNQYGIGYLVAAVTTAQFETAYKELLISAEGRMGIIRSDGTSLVTVPDDAVLATAAGRRFAEHLANVESTQPALLRLPSPSGAGEAITIALRLARQPALVYATFNLADLERRWQTEALPQVIGGGIATFLLVLVSFWLLHLIRLHAHEARMANTAFAEANAANIAKRQFLANMSHELRTPLNAILGFSEVIAAAIFGPLDVHYRSYGGDIAKSGRHLLHLVDQLLDISRIEAGQIHLQLQPNDLQEVFAEALKITADTAGAADIRRSAHCAADARMVMADRGVLRQILINLLSNAMKFNRPGGSVDLSARRVGNMIEIVVADTGIGIAAEDLPGIFDPFKKGDAHLAQKPTQGLRLGLPIVRNLVEASGGTIEIVSDPKTGTIVTVQLSQPIVSEAIRA